MARRIKQMNASAENFKSYICGKESPVTDILESAKLYANDGDVVLKLNPVDAERALQASEEVIQKAYELQTLCIAEESISSSVDSFIDQYINSDKSKVILYYNQRIDAAVTEDDINNIVVSIEDDLGEMEDFIDGKLTLPAFLRFVVTWLACVFGAGLLGLLGLIGAVALACQKYNKVERIRRKTQMLTPVVEKALEKAKAKQKKILKIS